MSDKVLWEAGKEYNLRIGSTVIIDATNRGGKYPIHGAYYNTTTGNWTQISFSLFGENQHFAPAYDLLPSAKPRIKGECWLVVEDDRGDCASFYDRREALRYAATYHNKAIIHVTYDVEEGEGLA